jgi:type II restriction/modification system DNA methylase subunit YeeA
LQLTICDPACGSGAFLNQALEFLIAEHRYLDELQAKLMGDSLILSDVENSILENNIYGVDLNDESVEIAKLSLWLRTAQKGRKLNSLNNNIKCGNSLIDDPEVAGDKAFSWEKEFPEVFAKGGFDVVIGNPPYVRVEFIDEISVQYFKSKYKSATSKFDLSSLFYELSIELLKPKGIYSIITSYQFLYASSGQGLRKVISDNVSCEVVKFSSDSQVFSGATTYAGIFFSSKVFTDKIIIHEADNKLQTVNLRKSFSIPKNKFTLEKVIIENTSIIDKIYSNNKIVKGKEIGMAKTGVVTSADDIFYLTIEKINELKLEQEIIFPIIGTNEINPWNLNKTETFCLYPYFEKSGKTILIPLNEIQEKYPNIYNYLIENKAQLLARSQGRKDYSDSENWYQLNRPREKWIYDSVKIIYPGTTNRPKFSLDTKGQLFRNARVYAFILKEKHKKLYNYLLPILNSNLSKYLIQLKCPPKANNYFEMSTGFMDDFPFIIPSDFNELKLIEYSEKSIELRLKLKNDISKFSIYASSQYHIEKLSGKLSSWYELDFPNFIKELNKAIKTAKGTPLTKKDEFEWIELFEENKKKALALKSQIDQTDKEIDKMVYELYGLTEEEIAIVEGS